MPIKEISAESVRDKSIRHGHISTLHLWWARRPLPVCRAVVFASLVPDPLDENCPQVFRNAIEILLGAKNNSGDPYKPYEDIPYTVAQDKMQDNLRNRLLMFIGKFSDKYVLNERQGKKTDAKDQLSDASLIKWDNKNNEEIIGKARKLIWVAHNSTSELSGINLIKQFDKYYDDIKNSEEEFYSTPDRHKNSPEIEIKRNKLEESINAFLDMMPKVFDPFAGGGAIPLEAARLGCRTFGNDLNPVAHIIQKGSLQFPQKYGKPIQYTTDEFIRKYGLEQLKYIQAKSSNLFDKKSVIRIDNRLSFDVEFYAKYVLEEVRKEIGYLYPTNHKEKTIIAYYWARVATCSNPTCKAEVPLLKQFYLANTNSKQVFLKPEIKGTKITFSIQHGKFDKEGWNNRGNLKCPCCGSITDVKSIKQQSIANTWKQRLLSVIQEGENGKEYRLPTAKEIEILYSIPSVVLPTEKMQRNSAGGDTFSWGISEWGKLFSARQILVLSTFCSKIQKLISELNNEEKEYNKAIITYLGLWIDKIAAAQTSFGRWNIGGEKIETPFSKQAIPMIFDFPEGNVFSNSTGSALNLLDWILRYINSESNCPFTSVCENASSGEKEQFQKKSINGVITDPPYYDAIAYADLSDFFYLWLKRSISELYPTNFATPQTPKTEECTALKHHHNNDKEEAKIHFETKLTQIFDAIEHQTSDIVSIMFAHQSTEAWSTLCNSILAAGMNITGSWAIDTEMASRSLALAGAVLESSVTVSAKPSQRRGIAVYKDVRKKIEENVLIKVEELYTLGLRGADLLTACFGQAASVFGTYEKVEKADGSFVTVFELLEIAKESAFNALLKGFNGDDYTKFYIGWLQLFGFTESDFDDAAKFARVGLTINVSDLFAHNLFIKKGNKQELAGYKERLKLNHRIGEGSHSFIIDFVHKAMSLYEGANRNALLAYIEKVAASPDNSFWRVITSLCEILPQGSDDYKQASGLLLNKDSLIRESKNLQQSTGAQGQLF